MKLGLLTGCAVAALSIASASHAQAQSSEEMLRRLEAKLDTLSKENAELRARVKRIETTHQGPTAPVRVASAGTSASDALPASAVSAGHTARAADLPSKAPVRAAPIPYDIPTGWYAITGASFPLGKAPSKMSENGCVYLCTTVNLNVDSGYSMFAGAGYRFSPFWRADIQIQYASAEVSNKNVTGTLPAFGFNGSGNLHGRLNATTVATNGYFDIAPLFGPRALGNFEPYVGAGVLYTHAAATDFTWVSTTGAAVTASFPSITDTAWGWQVTAGTAYRLNRNWLVDVAYIYRDYGKFQSGNIAPGGLPGGASAPLSSFSTKSAGSGMSAAVRYEF